MQRHLVVDIETVPDPSIPFDRNRVKMVATPLHPDPFADAWEIRDTSPFPPPPCHRIVTIGYCLLEDYAPKVLKCAGEWDKDTSEKDQLESFLCYLEKTKPTLVTFNGRRFDVPVLMTRALRYGLSCPWWFSSRDTRYRYSTTGHLDLMDFLADYGAAPNSSMASIANHLGLPGKLEGMDGSRVEDILHEEGGLQRIKEYCLSDVLQEAIIFLRVQVLRGMIARAQHDKAVLALRDLAQFAQIYPDRLSVDFMSRVSWDDVLLSRANEGENK